MDVQGWSATVLRWRFLAVLLCLAPVSALLWRPHWGTSKVFIATCGAVGAQVAVILVPRVLWFQFETKVVWEDIRADHVAARCLLTVSNLVTVVGFAVCCTILAVRVHAGDFWSMSTVAEVGSTLFLVKQAQAAIGPPALSLGKVIATRRQRRLQDDLELRPVLHVSLV